MSQDMLGKVIRVLVTVPNEMFGALADLLEKLVSADGAQWFAALKKFLRKEEVWVRAALLKFVTTTGVSAAQSFVARDHLQSANVGWRGSNFDRLFLDKVEEEIGEATIAIHKLERASLDAPILTELGNQIEISLAHFFELLKKQSKGEKGSLLINGYANIAYIRGNDGILWAVYAIWFSGDRFWRVDALSVEGPYGWRVGYQVLSRDS